MENKDLDNLKQAEFYSQSVNAWLSTSLEHDKSILSLSAGAIGLLITLFTSIGLSNVHSLLLYILAIISFVISLVTVLLIFKRNRTHVEAVLQTESVISDPLLGALDTTAIISFSIGVILTVILGLSSTIESFVKMETQMSEKTQEPNIIPFNDSYNGLSGIAPTIDKSESFNGLSQLQSTPTTSTQEKPTPQETEQTSEEK